MFLCLNATILSLLLWGLGMMDYLLYYCLPVCINEANPSISLVLYDQRLAGNAIMAAAHLGVSCGDLIGSLIPIA